MIDYDEPGSDLKVILLTRGVDGSYMYGNQCSTAFHDLTINHVERSGVLSLRADMIGTSRHIAAAQCRKALKHRRVGFAPAEWKPAIGTSLITGSVRHRSRDVVRSFLQRGRSRLGLRGVPFYSAPSEGNSKHAVSKFRPGRIVANLSTARQSQRIGEYLTRA